MKSLLTIFHLRFYFKVEVGTYVDFWKPKIVIERASKAYHTTVVIWLKELSIFSIFEFESVDFALKSSKRFCMRTPLRSTDRRPSFLTPLKSLESVREEDDKGVDNASSLAMISILLILKLLV